MHISAPFDSRNIHVVDASDPSNIQLEIVRDVAAEHRQWFYFRVTGAKGVPLRMRVVNAKACSYPDAWEDYAAAYSTDREEWLREPNTRFHGGALEIEHTPTADAVWFAYFAPYTLDRHDALLANCQQSSLVTLERLGATVDGLDLDMLRVGEPGPGKRNIWVIARQHPGESMAEWFVEGMLERLLDPADGQARRLLAGAVLYVVPNMNPDGSRRGHLRTNAAGANLNREWHEPTLEKSPEVLLVRQKMDETGVDLCLDVHGDEELPYNFIAGAEGVPSWSPAREALQKRFLEAYVAATPDFQTLIGYGRDAPGQANMTMCTNQIAERFGALAMTLEMPFKDSTPTPDPVVGWSPDRAARLGADVLFPMVAVLPTLR
jgi:murein tripeptide amidase MpaA